jgi:hypothetical protein
MEFQLKIELGNDTIQTADDIRAAVKDVAKYLKDWRPGELPEAGDNAPIRDVNGNTVGGWKMVEHAPASNPLEDPSNLATVLAALRLFQRTYDGYAAKHIYDAFPDHFTAADGSTIEPLSTDDIDALCVDLNCGAPVAAPAKAEPRPHLAQEIIAELEGWAWPVAATKEHGAMKMINAARVREIIQRKLSSF